VDWIHLFYVRIQWLGYGSSQELPDRLKDGQFCPQYNALGCRGLRLAGQPVRNPAYMSAHRVPFWRQDGKAWYSTPDLTAGICYLQLPAPVTTMKRVARSFISASTAFLLDLFFGPENKGDMFL
jgi:hypothetical protein